MAKKLLALVLSVMLMVSTVSSVFTVFATAADEDTNVVTIAGSGVTQTENSDVTYTSYAINSGKTQADEITGGLVNKVTQENTTLSASKVGASSAIGFQRTWDAQWADGDLTKKTDNEFGVGGHWVGALCIQEDGKWVSEYKDFALDFVVDLGASMDFKGLLIANDTRNDWRWGAYEVYVADSKEALFTSAPIAKVSVDRALIHDFNTDTPEIVAQNYTDYLSVADGKTISGQFVGIRVTQLTNRSYSSSSHAHLSCLRVTELGVYAEETNHTHNYSEKGYNSQYHWDKCSVCGDDTNKVAHTLEFSTLGEQGHGEACECGYSSDSTPHEFTTLGESAGEAGHKLLCDCGAYTVEAHNFTDIAYDSTSCWKACACGEKGEVTNYSDDARFAATGAAGSTAEYMEQVAIADSLLAGKQPIAVYYLNTDGAFKTRTAATIGDNWVKNTNGQDAWNTKNLTLADNVEEFSLGGAGLPFAVYENGRIVDCFNDESRRYIDLVYDLGDGYNINDIAIYGHPSEGLTLYKYRVSFASREEDLFADYSITSDVLTNFGSIIKIDCNEVSGRYFGIRVIAGMTPLVAKTNPTLGESSTCFRLRNISVFGEAAHTCDFNIVKYDEEGHWTECECGETTEKVAHDFATLEGDNYVCECGATKAAEKYTVSFLGYNGDVVYTAQAIVGFEISADDIAAAQAAVAATAPYGYVFDGFDSEIPAEEGTVGAKFAQSKTEYTVTVNGEVAEKTYKFDSALTFTAPKALTWMIDGNVVGYGTTVTVYVAGNMNITTSEEAPAASSIAIIGSATNNGKFIVMAKAYIADGVAEYETGVEYSKDGKVVCVESKNLTDKDFMTGLLGGVAGIQAKAYIKIGDEMIYSAKTVEF